MEFADAFHKRHHHDLGCDSNLGRMGHHVLNATMVVVGDTLGLAALYARRIASSRLHAFRREAGGLAATNDLPRLTQLKISAKHETLDCQ